MPQKKSFFTFKFFTLIFFMGPATVGMDEWMDGGMDGWKNGWMEEWMDG